VELELGDPRWQSFLSSQQDAGPFHHPAWAALLAECYGFRPFAFATADAAGTIVAGVPMLDVRRRLREPRRLSLPFTDACPPLAASEDARTQLAARLAVAGRLELHAPLAGTGLVARLRGVTHVLGLDADAESLRRRFHSQMRRNVKRAERGRTTIRAGETRSDLVDVFYDLHLRTRRRQGVPVQPRRFFRLLWDEMIEPGRGTLLLAYSGRTAIAGAVFLGWNGNVTYKFGASDPLYWDLRPNNLIFWTAIRDACARGDRRLDFGRTDLDNTGLRAFKSGWGAQEEPLYYTFAGTAPRTETRSSALAGLIRRSPVWFCRAVGEAAYRYAA
jgi:CelD/BcsL family acetyltransferase involved in cellulose biosynthesis